MCVLCCATLLPTTVAAQLENADFSAMRAEYAHLERLPGWTPLFGTGTARFVVETVMTAPPGDRHANVGYFSELTSGFGANKLDRCIPFDRDEPLSLSVAVRTQAVAVSNDLRVRVNPNFYADLASCEQDVAADATGQRLSGVNANLDWDLLFGTAGLEQGVWYDFDGIDYPAGQTPDGATVMRVSLRARDSGVPSAERRIEFGSLAVTNGSIPADTVQLDFSPLRIVAGRALLAGSSGAGWFVESGVLQVENAGFAVAGANVVSYPELTTNFGANRIDQCVALPSFTDFGVALRALSDVPHPELALRVNVRFFSDATCSTQAGGDLETDFAIEGSAGQWHLLETTQREWPQLEAAGATHARVSLRARDRSGDSRSFYFDDVFVPGGLVLSPPPGAYAAPQVVSVGALGAGQIARYTLDGSDPTASSPEVGAGVTVGTSAVVSIRVFDALGNPLGGVQRAHYQLDITGAPEFVGLPDGVAYSGVVGDVTDWLSTVGLMFAVTDEQTPAAELIVEAVSSNAGVVANDGLLLHNDNGQITLRVVPVGVGFSNITVTVTDGDGLSDTRVIRYAASAHAAADAYTRWYSGRADASAAIDLGGGLFMVFDDEGDHRLAPRQDNAIQIHDLAASGPPLATLSVDDALGLFDNAANCEIAGLTGVAACNSDGEVDYEAAVRLGDRIYVTGSHSNNGNGRSRADRWRFFAADLVGSGAATTLDVAGYYRWLREDLRSWDADGLHGFGHDYFGLVASSAGGDPDPSLAPESPNRNGFSIEGLSLSPDNGSAWFAFRAPLVAAPGAPAVLPNDPAGRTHALIVQVENYDQLAAAAHGGLRGSAVFGQPIRLDLGGRGVRDIRRNDAGQYLIIAGPSASATGAAPLDFRLYAWDGSHDAVGEATNLILLQDSLAGITPPHFASSPEGIITLPADLGVGGEVYILSDAGDVDYYANGVDAKALEYDAHKKFRVDRIVLGAPLTAGQCGAAAGVPSLVAPTTGLCAAGTAGAVLGGAGVHEWTCAGILGGADAQCTAPGLEVATGGGQGAGGGQVTATFDGPGCEVESASLQTPPAGGPAGVTMPFGVLDFALSGCTGNGVTVTVTYSHSVAGMTYWKYIGGEWKPMPAAMLSGNTAVFTIEDNGEFDADPATGRIADPGGPGILGNGVTAIPAMSLPALLALVGLLGLVALVAPRSRMSR